MEPSQVAAVEANSAAAAAGIRLNDVIDRLDDMDTETYRVNQCDAAETVSRQLTRMLERKQDAFRATDKVFNSLGCGQVCGSCH